MTLSASMQHRLQSQHEALPEILSGTDASRLVFIPAPGKWSIHDNIAHLARYNIVFIDRIHAILNEHEPVFNRYNADDDPEFETWKQKSTEELMNSIRDVRPRIYSMAASIPENDLRRVGMHPRFGRLTATGWLEFFLLHEAHHLFTIFQLAKSS